MKKTILKMMILIILKNVAENIFYNFLILFNFIKDQSLYYQIKKQYTFEVNGAK